MKNSSGLLILLVVGAVAIAAFIMFMKSNEPLKTPPAAVQPVAAAPDQPPAAPSPAQKAEELREQLKAKLLAQAPQEAEKVLKADPKAKNAVDQLLNVLVTDLESEFNSRLAINKMEQCVKSALESKVQLPPDAVKKFGPGGLKAELQASCMINAGNIIERYPQLSGELKTKVLSQVMPEAIELIRSRGNSAAALAK